MKREHTKLLTSAIQYHILKVYVRYPLKMCIDIIKMLKIEVCCGMLWYAVVFVAVCCGMLWYAVVCCGMLWYAVVCCGMCKKVSPLVCAFEIIYFISIFTRREPLGL